MSIISVKNLCKNFKIKKKSKSNFLIKKTEIKSALKDVSFDIEEGEILGYIGPNGAGKSTTIKILSGILLPTSGDVTVMNKTPWKNRLKTVSNLGVVFGQRTQLWWDLPVIESFNLLKKIYKITNKDYEKSLSELTDILKLKKLLKIPVRQLSLGQRMRCDLAASLLHSPKILFLDEPTIGMDASTKIAMRDFIKQLNKEYKITILLTTHDMDDVESLCKRILILNNGKIFFDGNLSEIRQKIAPEKYLTVDLKNKDETLDLDDVKIIQHLDGRYVFSFNPQKIQSHELVNKITKKHAITDLIIENSSIEKIIAKLYQDINL